MKKTFLSSMMVAVGCLMMVSSAMAYPVGVGDNIYVDRGVGGATGGGAFTIDLTTDGNIGWLFDTFCLERNEYLTPFPGTFRIDTISNGAINGGLAGGNPDLLSSASAYLMNEWATWGISHTAANANALQLAVWTLEQEWTEPLAGLAKTFYDDAVANNNGGLYGVQVMNLSTVPVTGALGVLAQDLMVYTPVPEPAILLLLGSGLLALFGIRRFKK